MIFDSITVAVPDVSVLSLKGVSALMVLAVALAAATAALTIKGWDGAGRTAMAGGLLYGLAPPLISFAVGGLTFWRILIAPIAFLIWDEILVRQRHKAWLVGPALAILIAMYPSGSLQLLVPVAAASLVGLIVIAMCYPGSLSEQYPHALRCFAIGVPVFLLALAYPLTIQIVDPRHLTASVSDNHTILSDAIGGIMNALKAHQGSEAVAIYLVVGIVAAIIVTILRGAQVSWTIVPIIAMGAIALLAVVPHLSHVTIP